MKYAPRTLVVAMALAAGFLSQAGCGGDVPPEGSPAEPVAADPLELERAMARLGREHEADLAAQAARLDREYEERSAAERAALEDRLEQAGMTVQELEAKLAQRDRQLTELRKAQERLTDPPPETPTARVSVFQPPLPPMHGMAADPSFPLRIYDVAGRKTKSGTHTSLRFSTVEVDDGGQGPSLSQKVRVPEPYEVDEYSYEVVFSVENLSDRPQSFNMRAGSVTRTAYLEAGETRTNLSITAMIGAPLIITTDAHRRRFPVAPIQGQPGG